MGREKPGIPKGTRDFNPLEVARREYIFDQIKAVFRLHGFMPIETPAMENLQTLMGKYGEEGDRLIFRILNSGDFAASADASAWENRDAQKLASQISEKALRYDLTVPFARYVVQYQNDIVFPFKRYQIQPVWRADRPQKGRYREFFQCDVDVIGSDSLTNELEFIQIISEVFHRLKVAVVVKLNNRKVLAGLAEYVGHPDKLTDITVAIDKMDKIGLQKVNEELAQRGLSQEAIEKLRPVMELSGGNSDKLSVLKGLLAQSATGLKGIEELSEVFALIEASQGLCEVELDLTLARGLNYYTGAIIEVKAKEVAMGSICGGGRYDDLTGVFGLSGTSGVGISFGADRIYDVLLESDGFPMDLGSFSQVLAINFGPESVLYYTPLLQKLRSLGLRCELYPDPVKIKKQMQYADKNRVPFVIMAGEEETARGMLSLKDMKAGTQEVLKPEEIARRILEHNA